MSIHLKKGGFSLIELLVVMVILGITSSLVAPDMFSIVKRSQAKTELAKIKAIAELSVERSFFSASKIIISFKDDTVFISQLDSAKENNDKTLKTIKSEFFSFEETTIVINKGRWQGSNTVKIVKSPGNKLKEFVLFETEDNTEFVSINDEAGDGEIDSVMDSYNDVEGSK